MEFSEFVQLLHPIIGGSSSTHAFARTIFDAIVNEDGLTILNEYSESSFKAYYNGTTKITKIAKAISPYVDQTEFASYFDAFSDEAMLSVCGSFNPFIPSINVMNAGEELAALFAGIIKTAASAKRKSAPKDANRSSGKTPYDVFSEKILASGRAMADAWGKAMQAKADDMSGADTVEAEVVDGAESSGAAEEPVQPEAKIQIIEKATVVNQYGENCIHIDHVDTFKL